MGKTATEAGAPSIALPLPPPSPSPMQYGWGEGERCGARDAINLREMKLCTWVAPPSRGYSKSTASHSTRARSRSDSTCRAWGWPGLARSARLLWDSKSRASSAQATWPEPGIQCSAEAKCTRVSAKPRSHGHPNGHPRPL